MALTLNFQGQIWNSLYLGQKWFNCHETKCKHIDWTKSLKCDHRILSWPWPWPWIFKIKYGIHYIPTKNGPIATKQNANISIGLKASNLTIGFDLGRDLELSRSNMESVISWQKWSDCHETKMQTYRLNFMNQMWSSDLSLAMTYEFSRSNLEFAKSQPKMVWLPQNEKYAYRINWRPQWPPSLTWATTLIGGV